METIATFQVGLFVEHYPDLTTAKWTITGYPKQSMTVREFDSTYDFEDFIREKIPCDGIKFDSESGQFYAYAQNKADAIDFAKRVDDYFANIRKQLL